MDDTLAVDLLCIDALLRACAMPKRVKPIPRRSTPALLLILDLAPAGLFGTAGVVSLGVSSPAGSSDTSACGSAVAASSCASFAACVAFSCSNLMRRSASSKFNGAAALRTPRPSFVGRELIDEVPRTAPSVPVGRVLARSPADDTGRGAIGAGAGAGAGSGAV